MSVIMHILAFLPLILLVVVPLTVLSIMIWLSVSAGMRDERWRKSHPPLIVDSDIEFVARQLCIATRRDPDNHGEGEGWESYADRAAMIIAGIEAYEQIKRHREP